MYKLENSNLETVIKGFFFFNRFFPQNPEKIWPQNQGTVIMPVLQGK